jgi:hypothetical protein
MDFSLKPVPFPTPPGTEYMKSSAAERKPAGRESGERMAAGAKRICTPLTIPRDDRFKSINKYHGGWYENGLKFIFEGFESGPISLLNPSSISWHAKLSPAVPGPTPAIFCQH